MNCWWTKSFALLCAFMSGFYFGVFLPLKYHPIPQIEDPDGTRWEQSMDQWAEEMNEYEEHTRRWEDLYQRFESAVEVLENQ